MKTLRIEFEDSPGHILTIISPVSLDAYFTVREAYEAGNWGERASFTALFAAWAPFVRSWSYKAPVSPEGMGGLDPHPLLADRLVDLAASLANSGFAEGAFVVADAVFKLSAQEGDRD